MCGWLVEIRVDIDYAVIELELSETWTTFCLGLSVFPGGPQGKYYYTLAREKLDPSSPNRARRCSAFDFS